MATLAYTVPKTAGDSGGSWSSVNNILVKSESPFTLYAQSNIYAIGLTTTVDRSIRLIRADVLETTDKSTNAATGTNVYGGVADLWGAAWTPADINNPGFGVAFAGATLDPGPIYGTQTSYLLAKNFGFSLPDTAVINGIQARVIGVNNSSGGGTARLDIDTIEVQITYTYNQRVYVVGQTTALVHSTQVNPQAQVPDKMFRYQVFDSNDNFIGEWSDVASEPRVKRDINNLLTNMDVELGRTEVQTAQAVDDLYTESAELVTDEADGGILAEIIAALGLGPGSNVELNYNIVVSTYFGYYEELTTEADELLMTEDDETLMVANGYPEGKVIYTGYISRWIAQYGQGNENLSISSLSHSNELKQIMYTTDDTAVVSGPAWDGYSGVGFSGGGPTDNMAIAQSWTQVGTVAVSRIGVRARAWGNNAGVIVTGYIIQGTPDAPGATMGTFSIPVLNGSYAEISAALETPVTFTNGVVYSIIFNGCNQAKTGGNETYPFTVALGTGYAGGQAYTLNASAPSTWLPTYGGGYDMVFNVYQPGGNTKVTLTGLTPGQIIRKAIDFAAVRGSRVRYAADTIDPDSITIATITFNANTVDEVIDLARKAAPSNYYTFFDPSTNLVYYKQRATTAQRFFTLGRDIVSLKLIRSIEQIVNEVYFTGGGNPALFDKTVDSSSQSTWRRGLLKMNDNRVTNLADSTLLSQNQIDSFKNPVYLGDLVVAAYQYLYPIEDVQPGEMWGFANFGNFIDQLLVQASSITYDPDKLAGSLGTNLPIVDQRVELLKQNLDAQAAVNNPSAPS